MLFFTELLERRVLDSQRRAAGKLHDIGMELTGSFPKSKFLVVTRTRRGRRETVAVPWDWISSLDAMGVVIDRERDEIWGSKYDRSGLSLARNLLDRQIVDLHGNKVVRVNDLRLSESNSHLVLTGVDVSQKALLRRLGFEKTLSKLLQVIGVELPDRTIPWNYVAPLEVQQHDLRLTVTQSQLSGMHPTDIADIIEQLEPYHRERLLDLFSEIRAAESISEVESGKQAAVIEDLPETRASNLLEIMAPDEAADILAILPRDKAERLLNIMGVEEAGIIRELLGYRKDSAGGRMTPELLTIPSHYTSRECIQFLRRKAPDAETFYYLYVVDDEGRLKGVVSLRDLLTSPADRSVEDFMNRDVLAVGIDDDQELVADTMRRYNFLALPVVDDANMIKGIITVDDMIDVLREEAIEDLSRLGGLELVEEGAPPSIGSRLPAMAVTLLGGMAAALLLSAFENRLIYLIPIIFFLPLVLRASQDIGVFSQAVVLEEIGGKELGGRDILAMAWKELRVVLLLSLGLGLAGGFITTLWEGYLRFGIVVGLTLAVTVLLGTAVGIFTLLISSRFKGELRYTQARFSSLLTGLATLAIYLGFTTAIL